MADTRILIVEDAGVIAMDVRRSVQQLGYEVAGIAASKDEAIQMARQTRPDLVLMDIKLSEHMSGIDAAAVIRAELGVPIIYVTAYGDEETLRQAKLAEPYGYVLKPFEPRELGVTIEMALYKHGMDKKLRESEERYRGLFEGVPIGLYRSSPEGRFLDANPAMINMLGYPDKAALLAASARDVYVDLRDRQRWASLLEHKEILRGFEAQMRRQDGCPLWLQETARAVRDSRGRLLYYEGSLEDITERKQTEAAWHEATQVAVRGQHMLMVLSQAAQAVQRAHTPQEVYQTIGDQIVNLGHDALVFTLNSDGTQLCLAHHTFESAALQAAEKLLGFSAQGWCFAPPPGGIHSRILAEGRACFFEDLTELFADAVPSLPRLLLGQVERLLDFERIIYCPLATTDKAQGLLVVIGRALAEDDISAMSVFAHQAAIALENARLYQAVEQELAERIQAEAALRESETRFRDVALSTSDWVWEVNTQGQYTFCSDKVVDVLGYTAEEILGKSPFDLMRPDETARISLVFAEITANKHPIENLRNWNITKDGREICLLTNGFPMLDEQSNLLGYRGVDRDITAQVRAERLLSALNQAARATEHILTPDEIFKSTAQELERLGFSCAVLLVDKSQNRLEIKYLNFDSAAIRAAEKLVGVTAHDFAIPFESAEIFKVIWERQTIFVENADDFMRQFLSGPLKALAGPVTSALKLPKFISAPLVVEDEAIGLLSVQSNDLTERDVPAVTAFAHQVAAAWRKALLYEQAQQEIAVREQAEAALRESEQRYRALFENFPVSLWEQDFSAIRSYIDRLRSAGVQDFKSYFKDHPEAVRQCADVVHVVDVNQTTLEWYGAESKEALCASVGKLLGQDGLEQFGKELVALASGQTSYEIMSSRQAATGEKLHLIIRGMIAPGYQESWGRVLVSVVDITKQVRAEEGIRRRARELEGLNKIGQIVTSSLDLDETLNLVVDQITRLLDVEASSLLLYDENENNLYFAAAAGAGTRFIRGQRLALGQGIMGWVAQHGQAAMVPDVTLDPRWFSAFDAQTDFETHSLLCVPVQSKGRVIGVLGALNKRGGAFDQEDMWLLNSLAAPAATAIENAQLYQAEQEQRQLAETLCALGQTLASTLDSNLVLDRLLTQVGRVVPHDVSNIMLIKGEAEQARACVVRWRGYEHFGAEAFIQSFASPIAKRSIRRQMIETRQPIFVPDVQADPRWGELPQEESWLRSYVAAPIFVQDRVIGFLNAGSATPGFFDQAHADRLQAFAHQAALALENARLFEETQNAAGRLQALSRGLVEVQEAERANIARELHDETGQALSSLLLGLSMVEKDAQKPQAVISRVVQLQVIADEMLENLHRLAMNLRPASLDYLGLAPSLDQYIQSFGSKYSLAVAFEMVGLEGERLSPRVEIALYRIVQEALTNILRHAQATRVDVLVERRGDQVVTIIEDDGQGFDVESAMRASRLGLLGMRERAETLGGKLTIESAPGAGTTIFVEVPYDSSPDC